MAGQTLNFNCPQCGKKFAAPAAAAGKTVGCSSCGASVTVPSASSPAPVGGTQSPMQQQFASSVSAAAVFPSPVPQSTVGGGNSFSGVPADSYVQPSRGTGSGARREFPALKFVAGVFVVISWLYVVGGVLAAAGVIGSGQGGQAIFVAILIVLGVALAAMFIRAVAEGIRLALYIAELLEDIRSK
jgi:hypothetical protein